MIKTNKCYEYQDVARGKSSGEEQGYKEKILQQSSNQRGRQSVFLSEGVGASGKLIIGMKVGGRG